MSTKTEKYYRALAVLHGDQIQLPPRSKPGLMKSETMYAILRANGWRWNSSAQVWHKVVAAETSQPEDNLTPTTVEQIVAVSDLFLIRIMAHKTRMPKIAAEIAEFAEVFDWEVLSASDALDNHGEGDFCRMYIRLRIKS